MMMLQQSENVTVTPPPIVTSTENNSISDASDRLTITPTNSNNGDESKTDPMMELLDSLSSSHSDNNNHLTHNRSTTKRGKTIFGLKGKCDIKVIPSIPVTASSHCNKLTKTVLSTSNTVLKTDNLGLCSSVSASSNITKPVIDYAFSPTENRYFKVKTNNSNAKSTCNLNKTFVGNNPLQNNNTNNNTATVAMPPNYLDITKLLQSSQQATMNQLPQQQQFNLNQPSTTPNFNNALNILNGNQNSTTTPAVSLLSYNNNNNNNNVDLLSTLRLSFPTLFSNSQCLSGSELTSGIVNNTTPNTPNNNMVLSYNNNDLLTNLRLSLPSLLSSAVGSLLANSSHGSPPKSGCKKQNKSYSCRECRVSVNSKYLMQLHKRVIHGKDKKIYSVCPHCSKSFSCATLCRHHIELKHSDRVEQSNNSDNTNQSNCLLKKDSPPMSNTVVTGSRRRKIAVPNKIYPMKERNHQQTEETSNSVKMENSPASNTSPTCNENIKPPPEKKAAFSGTKMTQIDNAQCLFQLLDSRALFKCQHCMLYFDDLSLYHIHMALHDDKNDPFSCKTCLVTFPNKYSFNSHLLNHK